MSEDFSGGAPVLVEISFCSWSWGRVSAPGRACWLRAARTLASPAECILDPGPLLPLSTMGLSREVQEWGKLIEVIGLCLLSSNAVLLGSVCVGMCVCGGGAYYGG